MDQSEFLHVIGIGGPEDWEAGRGSDPSRWTRWASLGG
jgi:hypothetical protein